MKLMMPQLKRLAIALFVSASFLGGCQRVSVWLTQNMRGPQPPKTQPAATATPGAEDASSNLTKAQRNAELLQEVYRVVMGVNPQSPADFGNWLDSLNQGASIEGVYNGFTHSGFQRALEADVKTTATPKAIGVFAQELAELLLEFPKIPKLTDRDARPLASIAPPGDDEEPSNVVGYESPKQEVFKPFATPSPAPVPVRPSAAELAGQMTKIFAGSSIYTLKRVLGEWGLKVLTLRYEESPDRMKDWYADFAARCAKKGVDFGLALRSEPSRVFHRQWADRVSDDQIRWEVLNRLHRILNAAQGA